MSTTFSVSRDDIIQRALRLCGAFDSSNPPGTADFTNIALAFNMMIKAWIRRGIPMWQIGQPLIVPLQTPVNTYQIGPYATGPGAFVTDRLLKVIYAFVRDQNNNDTPVDLISIQEYNQYSAKGSLGVPNAVMYRALNDTASPPVSSFFQVYPTPSDNLHSIGLVSYSVLNDVNTGTDPVDFPQECYQGLSWCLANEISMEYATSMDRVQFIMAKAEKEYNELIDWSQENSDSIRFMYDTRSR